MQPQTLYEKLWNAHLVRKPGPSGLGILYIDRHLIHEVTSPQAFQALRDRGLKVRRPERTTGVIDHSTPTLPPDENGVRAYVTEQARAQVDIFLKNCAEFGIEAHGWDSPYRGIVHVAAPELGLTQPGMTIVCGDSHTATHGAFGALAFGIGTTEVGHVLATQSLFQKKSKTFRVEISGALQDGMSAKDMALAVLAKVGFDGGTGCVIEYCGTAVRGLAMEGRMTLCNMSIEAGARSGMIAPDEVTFNWLRGRPFAPADADMDAAIARWRELYSDDDAVFDKSVSIDGSLIKPMVTFGTRPSDGIAIDEVVPQPRDDNDRAALDYMGIEAGKPLLGQPVKTVFIGSCTNARLDDLRDAARVMARGRVPEGVRALVVPGSNIVKRQAEDEGLDVIFKKAGAQWREAGCSMCIGMNGDVASPDGLTMSTSNRNFVGRQGPGARTVLCSPATAAAAAISGVVSDPRKVAC